MAGPVLYFLPPRRQNHLGRRERLCMAVFTRYRIAPLMLMASLACSARGVSAETVRDDWYFRESLAAVRDWEQILSEETAEAGRIPVLPVPSDGREVAWPNPIPARLVPARDRKQALSVCLVDGKYRIRRVGSDGRRSLEAVEEKEAVPGYQHPGGGGRDQWYHQYERELDRLTTFLPAPAPFAVELDGPTDFRRGPNELTLTARNAAGARLAIEVQLAFHGPKESHVCGTYCVELAAGGAKSIRFPVELSAPGGGLLILKVTADGGSYWLPLLTHVEGVAPVLDSIDQILSDWPDPVAARRLALLRREVDSWLTNGPGSGQRWSSLFEQSNRLRDELLLSRIDFGSLLFLKRKPFFSEQPFMDSHHLANRPGGGVYRLEPPRPDGKVTAVVDSLGEGVYRDLCLDWDAGKFVFAFGNGSDTWDGGPSYHLYEASADGAMLRQITTGPKNDCEPFYLANGQVCFTSDRSEHFVMCGGNRHAPNLFLMEADGSGVRQLSFNMFNDYTPSVLPDGRILFGRWEYNERSVTTLHKPFTAHPDGTMVAPYYGNATIRPSVVMFARPVPDSQKVMALFTAHHGQTHGAVGLIDVRCGADGEAPVTVLTPNVPVTGHEAEDSRHGWFSDPMPLAEDTWLCSYTPTVVPWLDWSWAIYVADRHGNLALIYRDPDISCAEPVPLAPRRRPLVMPSVRADCDAEDAWATLVVADVHAGMPEVPRGTARYLRVLEDVPRKGVHEGGVICTSGTPVFTVKRVLGTVPVEDDGSANFVVPANRNVYFQVLDADQREVQRMRSVVCLKPGEVRGCVGCHEPRNATPSSKPDSPVRLALTRAPSRPEAPPWGTEILSFLRDVQPVLNARCIACHTHDRRANRVILTDDLTSQFTIGYQELLPYLSVAAADRPDEPADVYPQAAYTYGSNASRLIRLLA
ncbi:MAG: HzsA-related protein, partial [Thermoguttaceae bacterium]